MRNQVSLNKRGKSPRYPLFIGIAFIALLVSLAAGCGGSKSANNTVAAVQVAPATLSMVAGQVVTLSTSAVNSENTVVNTTFTFNSTNTSIATISPQGSVCAGVWDSAFLFCNGSDAHGTPISESALIPVGATAVASGPVTGAVHPSITSVSVDP